jgi:hypothetical protein
MGYRSNAVFETAMKISATLLCCAAALAGGCARQDVRTTESGTPVAAPSAPMATAAPSATNAAAPPAPDPIAVRANGQLGIGLGHLYIDLQAPKGAKLTPDAPVAIRASGGIGLTFPQELHGPLGSHPLPLRLPIEVADGATGPARLELAYFWCTEGTEAVCRREQALLNVDLDLSGTSPGGEAQVKHKASAEL